MSYTIEPRLLPYTDKKGLQKICIYVYCNGVQAYPGTEVKIKKDQWQKGKVVNHDQKAKMNAIIAQQKNMYEGRLLEALKTKSRFDKNELLEILTGRILKPVLTFTAFAYSYIDEVQNKLSAGRIRHYNVIIRKVLRFEEKTLISDINGTWLQKFENWLFGQKLSPNTINTNIKIVKALVRVAEAKGLTEANFKGYKNPRIEQKIPEYLTEDEREKFHDLVKAIDRPSYKVAGYYYLLSCLTGYRIGDAKRFDYKKMVHDGNIIIRAAKNKSIVSLKIYPKLQEVLDFVKDHPLNLSEQKVRDYVKDICSLAGIKKRITYHSSRHGFSMFLLKRGFTVDEVAQLLGDSVNIARVYARINNDQLNRKVEQLLS